MLRAVGPEIHGALFVLRLLIAGLIALAHLAWPDPLVMIFDNLRVHLSALLQAAALLLGIVRARMRSLVLCRSQSLFWSFDVMWKWFQLDDNDSEVYCICKADLRYVR